MGKEKRSEFEVTGRGKTLKTQGNVIQEAGPSPLSSK